MKHSYKNGLNFRNALLLQNIGDSVYKGPNNRSSVKDCTFTHRTQVKLIVRILQRGFFSFFAY